MATFTFIEDNGHGWLKVPIKLLKELNIADSVSSYSYIYKEHAFLEEDSDYTVFDKAMKQAGKDYSVKTRRVTRAAIRDYRCYNPAALDKIPKGVPGESITINGVSYTITANLGRSGFEVILAGNKDSWQGLKYRISSNQLNFADRI